jgi:hypothetical protein
MSLSPYGCNYIFLLLSVPFFTEKCVIYINVYLIIYFYIENLSEILLFDDQLGDCVKSKFKLKTTLDKY